MEPKITRHCRGLRRLTVLATILLLLSVFAAPVSGKLYKWVDKDGNVHYSDTVPPEHARQGREVKSKTGATVDEIEPPPTQEEVERRRREQAKQERDRILLMSYSSVEQIERTRDQRLETLQARINITESRMEKLREELERERQRAAAAERSGRGNPEQIHQHIEQIEDRITRNQDVIADTRAEMADIREKFAEEIERYRELTQNEN